MTAMLEMVPMGDSDYLAYAKNVFGDAGSHSGHVGAGGGGAWETDIEGLRREGRAFADAGWLPPGFVLDRIVRIPVDSVSIGYVKKGGALNALQQPADAVLRIETEGGASLQVERGSFTEVPMDDGIGYLVHGAWVMRRVGGQVEWVRWEPKLVTSVIYPLHDKVIFVRAHPGAWFTDDTLLQVARSVSMRM